MTGKQGFASMTPERRREISAKGGASIPKEKRSFSKNRALAVTAGKKGGKALPNEKRSFSTNRELAVEAGRKGGENTPPESRSFHRDRELASESGRKGGVARARALKKSVPAATG